MRRKPTIRKRWVVTIPGYGFAKDTVLEADGYEAARTALRDHYAGRPQAGTGGSTAHSGHDADGIAPIPAWTPFW